MSYYGKLDPVVAATLEGAAVATPDLAAQCEAIHCAGEIWVAAMSIAAELTGKNYWVEQRIGDA
jgi:hypothetical protein